MSRLSHRPSDLPSLSRSSSFSIHPHNCHHLSRLFLSALFSPRSSLFIRLCRYLNLFPLPARLVFASRSFPSPHPGCPCPETFPQLLIRSFFIRAAPHRQTRAAISSLPCTHPTSASTPTPVLPRPCLSVAQMHLFNTSSKQISGLLSATGRR